MEAKLPGDIYRLFTFNFLLLIACENYKLREEDEFSVSLLKSILRLGNLKLHVDILLGKELSAWTNKSCYFSNLVLK